MADAPKILGSDSLRQAYPKLNSAIDNSNEAIKKATTAESNSATAVNTANTAETKADNVQTQFNEVVLEGSIDPETAQARVNADGTTYTTLQERLNSSDTKLVQRGINIKDFGAKGNANYYSSANSKYYEDSSFTVLANDDTNAFKAAVSFAATMRTGKVIVPRGRYLISDTINVNFNAFVFEGVNTFDSRIVVAPNFANGQQGKPIFLIYSGSPSIALDKVNIRQIGFNAANDNMNTRGIQFEYLIYTSGFEYLDFEQFSGAAIYSAGLGNDRSEMITFHQIRIQPRGKVRVEPSIYLKRVNEFVMMNNRFFAKEKGAATATTQPSLKLQGCQGIHIFGQNSFFYSDDAAPIQIVSGTDDTITQGVFINGNTFELCNYANTIEISGKGTGASLATTDVEIGRNRFNSSAKKLTLTNVINAQVLDQNLSVDMNAGVDGCTVFTNSTYGVTVNDTSGQRNSIVDFGSDFNKGKVTVRSKQYNTYLELASGANPRMTLKSLNSTAGQEGYIEHQVPNASWTQRQLVLNAGEGEFARVTSRGFQIKVTTGTLPTTSVLEGTMVFKSDDNSLNVYLGGAWRKTILT